MEHLAIAVDISHTQAGSFQQAQSAGIDRLQANLILKTMDAIQYPLYFIHAENNRQFLFSVRTSELQDMPFFSQCAFIEELDSA